MASGAARALEVVAVGVRGLQVGGGGAATARASAPSVVVL
jgi:hypothetical protein